jgi:uncharacterized tellurite resistance protein B-like protein
VEGRVAMRSYPTDSPRAAARIVALTMLADGHLAQAELDALERCGAHHALGLSRDALHGVLHALCEDLLSGAHLNWGDACRVDGRTLAQLMAEVADPALRLRVLQLCLKIVQADGAVEDGEALMLRAAVEHWGLHHEMFEPA